MRALAVVLVTLALTAAVAHAQNCGEITVTGSSLDSRYASCTQATNVKVTSNSALTVLSLQYLTKITDSLIIESNSALQALDLPQLTWVDHLVSIKGNSHLSYITLNALDYTHTFEYQDNYRREVEIPQLSHVYEMTIGYGVDRAIFWSLASVTHTINIQSPSLTAVGLPHLATIGSGVRVASTTYLTTVSLPALATAGAVWFESNTYLYSIQMPVLVTLTGGVNIQNNANLNTLELPALQTLSGSINMQPISNLHSCQPILVNQYQAKCP